ncbi:hypothetical protein PuT2_00755 [Pusillimonas sp. T2]|nr:hypothetical protein PuT2_00755 [Pusillimonas sp. T2]
MHQKSANLAIENDKNTFYFGSRVVIKQQSDAKTTQNQGLTLGLFAATFLQHLLTEKLNFFIDF